MKDLKKNSEVVINVPMKFKYYLDPLAILVGALIVCASLWYVASLV